MDKEKCSKYLEKTVCQKRERIAIVTKDDLIEIIDLKYEMDNDNIIINTAKSQKYNKLLFNVLIPYSEISYLTKVHSVYA